MGHRAASPGGGQGRAAKAQLPHGGTRIAHLPAWLRPAARVVRDALPERALERLTTRYVYKSDGIATAHHSPFLDDSQFDTAYRSVVHRWSPPGHDLRWRIWILTSCARQCRGLPGAFAEFGVYRGASAFMILSRSELPQERLFYLFDTFQGIPSSHLTTTEKEVGFFGRLSDTSADEVALLLDTWRDQVNLVAGDLYETLPRIETGPLAFVHLDLNAAGPTRIAMEYAYERLVQGGLLVFDDYGWRGYEDQRALIHEVLHDKPESLIALPTGQALLAKQ